MALSQLDLQTAQGDSMTSSTHLGVTATPGSSTTPSLLTTRGLASRISHGEQQGSSRAFHAYSGTSSAQLDSRTGNYASKDGSGTELGTEERRFLVEFLEKDVLHDVQLMGSEWEDRSGAVSGKRHVEHGDTTAFGGDDLTELMGEFRQLLSEVGDNTDAYHVSDPKRFQDPNISATGIDTAGIGFDKWIGGTREAAGSSPLSESAPNASLRTPYRSHSQQVRATYSLQELAGDATLTSGVYGGDADADSGYLRPHMMATRVSGTERNLARSEDAPSPPPSPPPNDHSPGQYDSRKDFLKSRTGKLTHIQDGDGYLSYDTPTYSRKESYSQSRLGDGWQSNAVHGGDEADVSQVSISSTLRRSHSSLLRALEEERQRRVAVEAKLTHMEV